MGQTKFRFDLLSVKPIRAMVASPAFPIILQVMMVIVVVSLAYFGLGVGEGLDESHIDILRKTNLSSLVVWGIWWPIMIVLVLAFGRIWCTVCPMELVNRVADAIARKIAWPRARMGKFLRAGWLVILTYITMQILVEVWSVNHIPNRTALVLLGLLGFAFLTGLLFKHPRSFCQGFCPAGALLSVYGRYTALQLDIRKLATCDECTTKDCIKEKNRHKFDKRSCPSLLQPFRRQASDGCVLCFQCAKVCPHDNMGWGIVKPDTQVRRKSLLKPFEAVFIMLAMGSVLHEASEEVPWLIAILDRVPEILAAYAPSLEGFFVFLWYIVLLPLAIYSLISTLAYVFGQRGKLGKVIIAAATGAAPIVAIAHFAKAGFKILSYAGNLSSALQDPVGLGTMQRIVDGSAKEAGTIVGLSVLGWIMLAATLVIAWLSVKWLKDLPDEDLPAARVGMAVTLLLFSSVLVIWTLAG